MTTVKIETIVNMNNELNNFKSKLLLALATDSKLPVINSEIILKKYIGVATKELNLTVPITTAKRIAKSVMTEQMMRTMSEQPD